MTSFRIWAACGLAMLVAAPRLAAAPPIEAPSENRYAAWHDAPFTCHDLVAADASKDDSTDNTGNYDAIMNWEAEFPKLAAQRDRENTAELEASVLKWCGDRNLVGTANPPLADIVEKAWRMMGY